MQQAFAELLLAAMKDAAKENKMTQLKSIIDPDGDGKIKKVRIIVIPEEMDVELTEGKAFCSKEN